MHAIFVDTTITTPPLGGAHTFLPPLTRGLTQAGWRVSLVTQPGSEWSCVDALCNLGVEVHSDLWGRLDLPEEKAVRLATWGNAQSPAVFVVSVSADVGWLALPHLCGDVRTVSITHTDGAAFYQPAAYYQAFLDCAVAVSTEIHRNLVQKCGVSPERVRTIPYGVDRIDVETLKARLQDDVARPSTLAFIGRVVHDQKRVLDFVPLLQKLREDAVAVELHIIGDGPDRPRLEQDLQRVGLHHHVRFHGWVAPADLRQALRGMDIFLLMSDFEGLSVALLEAMANGLAPVVSRIASGNSEVVRHGENGFLALPGDIDGFAQCLTMLAGDRSLLHSLQNAAWITSEAYSVERMVGAYLHCFREIQSPEYPSAPRPRSDSPFPPMASCRSRYPYWIRKAKRILSFVLEGGALP